MVSPCELGQRVVEIGSDNVVSLHQDTGVLDDLAPRPLATLAHENAGLERLLHL